MSSGIRLMEIKEQNTLSVRETVTMETIKDRLGVIYAEILQHMGRLGVHPSGPPFAMYHSVDSRSVDMEAGFPVKEQIVGKGRIKEGRIPGGKVITAMHVGPYTTLEDTYGRIMRWMGEHGYASIGPVWESYLTDPNRVKDAGKWRTEVFFPVR